MASGAEVIDALSQGWVTEVLRTNPVVSFALGMVALAMILGGLMRMNDNFWRSRSIDGAADKLTQSYAIRLDALTKDFDRALIRIGSVEHDRDVFYREKVDLSARVGLLEEQAISIRSENERLRTENSRLATEGIENRAHIRELESSALAQSVRVKQLQEKVDRLEAAANRQQRRATDKGSG